MLDTLNRHLMHPLMAWRGGSPHLRHLRTLRRTQFDPPEVIRARQLVALRAQLRHAWDTVPYYRAARAKAGVHPSDVRELTDLEAFPVVTKADIRRHNRALVSSAYDIAKCRVKTTSGSTGVPLTIYCDEPAMQWKAACTIRSDEWSGYRLGQRVAKAWGNPEYRHFGLKGRLRNHFFDRAVYLDTLHLDDDRITEFTRTIRAHRPGLIFGHAHSLYLLACSLKKSRVHDVRPNGIISTAMILHDWQRAVIEEVFGCKVTNRYGCEEVSLIASECEEHNGLHVNADSIYHEVQADGKLLVTDLSNRAMPLIRYQIGDVVVPSSRVCKCGRGLPLIERVEGRDADYVLTPAGHLISGISLTENFAVLVPGAAQVQIVQESVTRLRIRLVADDAFDDGSRAKIAGLVRDTFGDTVAHDVELVDAIPQEPSGKYRFCISQVAPGEVGGDERMTPTVSIVMAAKNYARFLPEAVESVFAQTFTDWELLVIDDGSSDDTPAACRPYLADRRVRYFRSDTLGQPRAKNLGISLSRGAFVAFLDADDAWESTKLEKQLRVFAAKPDVGVVFCKRSLMDEEGRTLPAKPASDFPTGFVLPDMFTQNFVCFSSAVVKRDVFAHVGAFDPLWDLAIDYDLWLRVAKFHRFDFVNEVLVRYRTGHGNLSKKLRDRVDTAMSIMHRAESRYGARAEVPAEVIADGYASTCQTLGYVLRDSEPTASLRWYLRALKWPARRFVSLKGLAAGALAAARGKRAKGSPENASTNA